MNNLESKIKTMFPNENIEVIQYLTMREPAIVKCKNCNTVYSLKRAENFVRTGKKCICKKCINNGSGGRLTLQDFQEKLNKKFPNEKLKAIKYTLRNEEAIVKCLTCGNIYTL